MNKAQILKLIKQGEGLMLEFKPSLSDIDRITEVVCSFANAKGGTVLVGVSDAGEIKGIDIGRQSIERLTDTIVDNLDPRIYPEIKLLKVGKKIIISIKVSESPDKPYLARGKAFIRIGKNSKPMSRSEYERLLIEKHKGELQFDQQICKRAKLTDIDKDKVIWFIKEAKKQRGLDIDEHLPIREVLERLKLIKGNAITNAAILLFGKSPQEFFLQAIVKAIRFKGIDTTGEMIDFKTFETNILTQLEKAEDFIFEHIPKKAWIEEGKLQRQEKWLYPPKAIREALANALAHRDYETTSNVQIRIFDDRLEIWNPGNLPPGLTIEKLKVKHDSIPHNPLLARVFFWVKYVEEVGTGTNKMIKWCKEWGLPAPDFEETGTSIVVAFKKSRLTELFLESLDLNERQRKGLEFFKEKKKITSSEYAKLFQITERMARNDLRRLADAKIIARKGVSKKTTYYVLTEI